METAQTLNTALNTIQTVTAGQEVTANPAKVAPLNQAEAKELGTLYTTILTNLKAYRQVGVCAYQIQAKELYREHGTIDNFFNVCFGMSSRHVYRLIAGYKLCELLLANGITEQQLPVSERHCRNLTPASLEKKDGAIHDSVEIWKLVLIRAAQEGLTPTTHLIDEEINKFYNIIPEIKDDPPKKDPPTNDGGTNPPAQPKPACLCKEKDEFIQKQQEYITQLEANLTQAKQQVQKLEVLRDTPTNSLTVPFIGEDTFLSVVQLGCRAVKAQIQPGDQQQQELVTKVQLYEDSLTRINAANKPAPVAQTIIQPAAPIIQTTV